MKRKKYVRPCSEVISFNMVTIFAGSMEMSSDDDRGSTGGGNGVMSNKQQGAWGDVWENM